MTRRAVTTATVVVGFVLMVLGYLGAAPWGADSVTNSNPRFSYAPALFVLGVIVTFSSALVYEVFRDRKS